MRARDHTHRQRAWFRRHGISLLDLAVRRRDATFICQHSLSLDDDRVDQCLPWVRYENARRRADVYVRPARGRAWPVVFFDDVPPPRAHDLARTHAILALHTSPHGGCHIWLAVSQPLTESERADTQRRLHNSIGADPGSISGEHWGRLAGMRNHKRAGCWVNVLLSSHHGAFDPALAPTGNANRLVTPKTSVTISSSTARQQRDESVAEFAWCCHRLRDGWSIDRIERHLRRRAARRGKHAPDDYARRTVAAALHRLFEDG